MIQPSVSHWQSVDCNNVDRNKRDWKHSLAQAIRDPAELLQHLKLPEQLLPQAIQASQQFPLRVPHGFVDRMQTGNPHDPLLLQVLPLGLELQPGPGPGFSIDPVGDMIAVKAPGMLQKYHGRALIISTGACGIHCRYCFRRHFPYSNQHLDQHSLDQMLDYLQQTESINEVILSGGDPLVLTDQKLTILIKQIEAIPHITRLRFHSRMPVVIPERITQTFLDLCLKSRLQVVMVIHTNHSNEIDANVTQALQSLRNCGITLLNQTVLLKKINDNALTLIQLSEKLFSTGVQPYYLHQLDRVNGAGHFEVDDSTAVALMNECREKLPGYLVPRLVREVAGEQYKRPLSMDNIT